MIGGVTPHATHLQRHLAAGGARTRLLPRVEAVRRARAELDGDLARSRQVRRVDRDQRMARQRRAERCARQNNRNHGGCIVLQRRCGKRRRDLNVLYLGHFRGRGVIAVRGYGAYRCIAAGHVVHKPRNRPPVLDVAVNWNDWPGASAMYCGVIVIVPFCVAVGGGPPGGEITTMGSGPCTQKPHPAGSRRTMTPSQNPNRGKPQRRMRLESGEDTARDVRAERSEGIIEHFQGRLPNTKQSL